MERGTDWERKAVHERWEALERERTLTNRLLAGITLASAGLILVGLAASRGVCLTRLRGSVIECTTVSHPSTGVVIALLGAGALGGGLWLAWAALRG